MLKDTGEQVNDDSKDRYRTKLKRRFQYYHNQKCKQADEYYDLECMIASTADPHIAGRLEPESTHAAWPVHTDIFQASSLSPLNSVSVRDQALEYGLQAMKMTIPMRTMPRLE